MSNLLFQTVFPATVFVGKWRQIKNSSSFHSTSCLTDYVIPIV